MTRCCQSLLCLLGAALKLRAADPLVDNSVSPHAVVRAFGLDEVRWTDGIWAAHFESCRTAILPSMGRLMEGTNYTQFFRNFEIAAGHAEGRYRGTSEMSVWMRQQ